MTDHGRSIPLNDGASMPPMGYGTWPLGDEAAETAVFQAIKAGYRLIDTAVYYGNERGVGRGVARAVAEGLVSRDELRITTKLMPSGIDADYDAMVEGSLGRLGLDSVDLLLLHQQGPGDEEAYRAIERAQARGLSRSIGLSNFHRREDLERMLDASSVVPAVIQNEGHLRFQANEPGSLARELAIVVETYYPLGRAGGGHLAFPEVVSIAREVGATPAQVVLAWHRARGQVPIPGTRDPAHMAENLRSLSVDLDDRQMERLGALDAGRRYGDW